MEPVYEERLVDYMCSLQCMYFALLALFFQFLHPTIFQALDGVDVASLLGNLGSAASAVAAPAAGGAAPAAAAAAEEEAAPAKEEKADSGDESGSDDDMGFSLFD